MGRRVGTAGSVVVLIVALIGCTPGGGTDEAGLVWAIGGAEAQPGGVHQAIAERWNELNPDTPVRLEVLPEDADGQREQQALELQAEGSGFDVIGMDVIWTGEYSENGWIDSLEDVRDQIEGQSLPGPFESATWGGELWGAPYNSNAGFLYYRTDLVDEPPTTWEELKEVGMAVAQENDMAPFVGQGARYEGFVVNFLEYFWGAGGDLYNEDQTEVLFGADDAAMTALDFMRTSLEDGFYAPGFNTAQEEEARTVFQEGDAVFMRNWPYAYSLIEEDEGSPANGNFDIAPLPTFTGEGTISALGGFNNAVSAFSNNKELAKEFVVWLSTDMEPQRMLGERGTPPSLAAVYEELEGDPVMERLGEVLPDARPRPPAPEWNQISSTMQRQLFPAYNGEADPQAAIDAVRDYLEGTIE
ncbi:MAG TPA: ABC transporter substrate-binding protein [Egibacteraceae bacterium]|jgi:multiple sugar transport system substrate-binding protein|nr:ABC transporter substrate-binding protein [Egibacteraceae bacterium]